MMMYADPEIPLSLSLAIIGGVIAALGFGSAPATLLAVGVGAALGHFAKHLHRT